MTKYIYIFSIVAGISLGLPAVSCALGQGPIDPYRAYFVITTAILMYTSWLLYMCIFVVSVQKLFQRRRLTLGAIFLLICGLLLTLGGGAFAQISETANPLIESSVPSGEAIVVGYLNLEEQRVAARKNIGIWLMTMIGMSIALISVNSGFRRRYMTLVANIFFSVFYVYILVELFKSFSFEEISLLWLSLVIFATITYSVYMAAYMTSRKNHSITPN